MFLYHRMGVYRNWNHCIRFVSCGGTSGDSCCPMHDPQHDGLLLSGLRGHAGDIRAAAWQNNNLPVLPSDCCIWGSCGRLVYDLTDDRAAFTGEALCWDALQRSVPMDCTCNRNRKLSGEKSCACNHRDCAAWIILTVSGKAAGSDHCNRYRTYPNMPSIFRRCYRILQVQKQMLQYK